MEKIELFEEGLQFENQLQFLQDTINFYWGKPELKCMNNENSCSYYLEEKPWGCAIGRCLTLEARKKLKENQSSIRHLIHYQEYAEYFPDWMKKMDYRFLGDVQAMHDQNYFSEKNSKGIRRRMLNTGYVDFDPELLTFPD